MSSSSFVRVGLFAVGLSFAPVGRALSQALPVGESGAGSNSHSAGPLVAPVNGFNFSLDYMGQHNSATGWANIVTPDLSFRFNRHLSVSSLVPWYLSVNAFVPVTAKGVTTYNLESTKNTISDTVVLGEYEASHKDLNYIGTASMGLPTGNYRFGLSARQVTYNVTNHFDYNLGPFDPDIEFGVGDSSGLTDQPVKKAYTAVGTLANFQVGTGINLPWNLNLDLEAYEDLPVGNQNVYGTVTKKNKKGKTVTRKVLEGTGEAEDNGLLAELDIPIGTHFMLAGNYERSLVQGLDTVSGGITWTLRRPKILAHASR